MPCESHFCYISIFPVSIIGVQNMFSFDHCYWLSSSLAARNHAMACLFSTGYVVAFCSGAKTSFSQLSSISYTLVFLVSLSSFHLQQPLINQAAIFLFFSFNQSLLYVFNSYFTLDQLLLQSPEIKPTFSLTYYPSHRCLFGSQP